MEVEKGIFERTELLLGTETMKSLSEINVIIFGIGGVGSWCAESLARSGVINITLVDSDRICTTNINRQIHATTETIGQLKTESLRKRLLEINPKINITALQKLYNAETHNEFNIESYHYIIDAIDTMQSKIHLIREATKTKAILFSSMGASLRINPLHIKVAEFWEVKGCPFGARIRKTMRKGELPSKNFLCVYSDEVLDNKGSIEDYDTDNCIHKTDFENSTQIANKELSGSKAITNGTVAHITAIFGFYLAGLIIQDNYNKSN